MVTDWQTWIALAVVAMAATALTLRIARSLQRPIQGCFGCRGCTNQPGSQLVQLGQPTPVPSSRRPADPDSTNA